MEVNVMREKLLKLRSEIAKKTKGATYLVFNDKELEMLLTAAPKSIEELCKLKGFPKDGKRVRVYGDALVSIFKGVKTIVQASSTSGDDPLQKSSVF